MTKSSVESENAGGPMFAAAREALPPAYRQATEELYASRRARRETGSAHDAQEHLKRAVALFEAQLAAASSQRARIAIGERLVECHLEAGDYRRAANLSAHLFDRSDVEGRSIFARTFVQAQLASAAGTRWAVDWPTVVLEDRWALHLTHRGAEGREVFVFINRPNPASQTEGNALRVSVRVGEEDEIDRAVDNDALERAGDDIRAWAPVRSSPSQRGQDEWRMAA